MRATPESSTSSKTSAMSQTVVPGSLYRSHRERGATDSGSQLRLFHTPTPAAAVRRPAWLSPATGLRGATRLPAGWIWVRPARLWLRVLRRRTTRADPADRNVDPAVHRHVRHLRLHLQLQRSRRD